MIPKTKKQRFVMPNSGNFKVKIVAHYEQASEIEFTSIPRCVDKDKFIQLIVATLKTSALIQVHNEFGFIESSFFVGE